VNVAPAAQRLSQLSLKDEASKTPGIMENAS